MPCIEEKEKKGRGLHVAESMSKQTYRCWLPIPLLCVTLEQEQTNSKSTLGWIRKKGK